MGKSDMIGETSVKISELVRKYPPRFTNRYKASKWAQVLESHRGDKLCRSDSRITISQYTGILDNLYFGQVNDVKISQIGIFFDYRPSDITTTHWYLNFADPQLFVAYGSNLFAQDEIQCLEHPLLGSVKEYLSATCPSGISTKTITAGNPTPLLVEGVPYMIEVNTNVLYNNRAYSIYGNAFHRTEISCPDILDMAIKVKDHFTESNIIVMCAPPPGYGAYSQDTVEYMLACAYVSFKAVHDRSKTGIIDIHTGRWGAGAFGGSEELALLIQIIAAKLSGISRLTFHAVDTDTLNKAKRLSEQILAIANRTVTPSDIVSRIMSLGYTWGISDGN